MAQRKTKWMIVFGPEGHETQFVQSPHGPGPGWTYSKKEAETMCPPGGRVVDAEKFVKDFNQRARQRP